MAKAKDEEVKVEGEEAEVEAKPAKKAKKTSATFTLKSGNKRTFSEAEHGEDWEATADEFRTTNTRPEKGGNPHIDHIVSEE